MPGGLFILVFAILFGFLIEKDEALLEGTLVGAFFALVICAFAFDSGEYKTNTVKEYEIVLVRDNKVNASTQDGEVISVDLDDLEDYSSNHKKLIVKEGVVHGWFLRFDEIIRYETK